MPINKNVIFVEKPQKKDFMSTYTKGPPYTVYHNCKTIENEVWVEGKNKTRNFFKIV